MPARKAKDGPRRLHQVDDLNRYYGNAGTAALALKDQNFRRKTYLPKAYNFHVQMPGNLNWRMTHARRTAGSNALTREGYVQAKGRLQCWNADGAGKGQAATLEQQRLTARGLGGSCREEAMQQLEDRKGGGRWRGSTPPVEGFRGFRGFKRLKAGKRQARMP